MAKRLKLKKRDLRTLRVLCRQLDKDILSPPLGTSREVMTRWLSGLIRVAKGEMTSGDVGSHDLLLNMRTGQEPTNA